VEMKLVILPLVAIFLSPSLWFALNLTLVYTVSRIRTNNYCSWTTWWEWDDRMTMMAFVQPNCTIALVFTFKN